MEDYLLVSFGSGELTPKVNGRTDIQAYKNGGELIKNNIILPQGPSTRRPGSEMMAFMNIGARLIEFEGRDNIGYVIGLTDYEMRIYKNGILDVTQGTSGVITTLWPEAILYEIQFATDGNDMYLVHNTIKPQVLTYTSTPTFVLSDYALTSSPTVPAGWDLAGGAGADFEDTGNYPGGVTFYEGRLLFTNTVNFPDYMWGSDVKNYTSFTEDTTLLATNAFEVKITAKKGPKVNWMVGSKGVFVGTDRGVFSVSDENNLLSPVSLITAKQNSSYPSSKIPGFMLGGELFYSQAGNRKIRMAMYDLNQDQYITPDITSSSEHITEGIIKDIAVQTLPETIVWVVLEDGTLITLAFNKENGIMAWTRHETEGFYRSICIVREGDNETVYANVERDSTGYLERFQPIDWTDKNFVFLDCYKTTTFGSVHDITSITWSAGAITVITDTEHELITGDFVQVLDTGIDGIDYTVFQVSVSDVNTFVLLDELMGSNPDFDDFGVVNLGTIQQADNFIDGYEHLANKDIFVMSKSIVVGEYTVTAAGEITLENRRTEFTAGYNYYSDLVPMNIGIDKNKKKRVVKLSIEVLNSLGGKAGKDENNLDDLVYENSITMDIAPDPFTGTISVSHRGGHEFNGDIMIRQDLPLPLTVSSLTAIVEVN